MRLKSILGAVYPRVAASKSSSWLVVGGSWLGGGEYIPRIGLVKVCKGRTRISLSGRSYLSSVRVWVTIPVRVWVTIPVRVWVTIPVRVWVTIPVRVWVTIPVRVWVTIPVRAWVTIPVRLWLCIVHLIFNGQFPGVASSQAPSSSPTTVSVHDVWSLVTQPASNHGWGVGGGGGYWLPNIVVCVCGGGGVR